MKIARNPVVPVCFAILAAFSAAAAAPTPAPKLRAAAAPKVKERPPSKEGVDFFEKKIRPVLVHNCYKCHSGDPAKAKGNLVLDTRDGVVKGGASGAVVVPGHSDSSLLIEAIKYEGLEMPPDGQLSDEVIEDFVQWVEMGAPDPRVGKAALVKGKIDLKEARKYWAFQPPKAVPPPAVTDTSWPTTEIDRLVRSKQEAQHLTPVPDADKLTLIRRVTFDLTGLPPTPEGIDAFMNDNSEGAFATVVDRLLASPRYGERWGRHWLDVVRYAESTGKDRNIPFRYAWRYRDYVIDSFNADKPYDRFIVEQLAGDLLPSKGNEERNNLLVATGFLAMGPKAVNTKEEGQFDLDVIDDQIDVTGRAFLGLTIACARCHDHKFDPIPTSDYYAMAGIFHSTNTFSGTKANKKTASDHKLLALTGAKPVREISSEEAKHLKEHQEAVARLEAQIENFRKQQKQAVKQMQMQTKAQRKGKGKQFRPGGNGAGGGAGGGGAMQKVNRKQMREEYKELEDQLDELESEPTPPGNFAIGVKEGNPSNYHVLNRGELKDKGPEVPRGVLTVLKTGQATVSPRHSGRLELAHWIADKGNPLTARVMANRVWLHLFGEGLVDTVDNFGALGNEPSNPQLLDALAVQFMNEKWSVKHLIRSIVLSRTYRLSGDHNDENYEKDASDKFLWRMERRRLDAEEIRDAMLMASGHLDLERPRGSPVMELGNGPLGRGNKEMKRNPMQELRKPTLVRSVYLPILRNALPDALSVFDVADPNLIVGKRDVTTVPTQALFLMNSPFALKTADEFAKRVLTHKGLDQGGRIDFAYRIALGRRASDSERADMARYINDCRKSVEDANQKGAAQLAAWTSFCQLLFQSAEFRYRY